MGFLSHSINRLLYHDKWAVGLIKLDPVQIVDGVLPQPVQWLAPRFGQYIADPFIYTHNDRDYLLYERFTYSNGIGKIAIAELMEDHSGQYQLHNEQLIIDEPFHQSYPFVFSFQDDIYCMPEQSESNSLRLYRAIDFPSTWVFETILIDDFHVVDPTLVNHNNCWWLFATKGGGQENEELYIWYSQELHGPWLPHSQNPVKIGLGKTRPAGPVFKVEDQLYRPVQAFHTRYGQGLLIEKILELSPVMYREETVAHIQPFAQYSQGLHHLCIGKNLTVVDGSRFANPLEVCLKLRGVLREKFNARKQ